MEGVGARLGRSSTRYGPATVFTGPVRKWKKKWVHVSPSTNNTSHNNHSYSQSRNGTVNGNNTSHLLLFKWTPISKSSNGSNNGDKSSEAGDEDATEPEEPPRRKFKYIPIALLEDHKIEDEENEDEEMEAAENEVAQNIDEEAKPIDIINPSTTEPTSKTNSLEEKPEINDVPMEESQDNNKKVGQDLNESTSN